MILFSLREIFVELEGLAITLINVILCSCCLQMILLSLGETFVELEGLAIVLTLFFIPATFRRFYSA